MIPTKLLAFRDETRRTFIPKYYSGVGQVVFITVVSLSVIGWSAASIRSPALWELGVAIPTFLFANGVEYVMHRWPMHHKWGGLFFQRHTLIHHRFYTHEHMRCESTRDFKTVMFPPYALVFFLGMIAAPVAVALYFAISSNVGLVFGAVAMSYFLSYEWLHLAYHLDPDGPLGRIPGLAVLRRHHTLHHNPTEMKRANFNITFPVFDWIAGTTR